MSSFNPAINDPSGHAKQTGYGPIFCNYPRRRVDYEINRGMESYQFTHFDSMKESMDPRPKVRNEGVLDSYTQGTPIETIPGYATPFGREDSVQDRNVPLNQDLVGKRLKMTPGKDPRKPLHSTIYEMGMPKVAVPNPHIPVYNHLIPYQTVTQFAECPCTPPKFQSVEHVWSNGTRVKGFDPRLAHINDQQYQSAMKSSRPFPRVNLRLCKNPNHTH